MARRAIAIKQERNDSKDEVFLVLDAGNSLAGQWLSLRSEGKIIVEAMSMMGYDALTLGQLEFALGMDVLKQREAEANFPFLSANVVSAKDEKLLFKPYTLLDRQGRRIGIIGLSELDVAQAPGFTEVAKVLDPVAAARQYVNELRGQVDLLVVLSHLGMDADRALAEAVPGIDIIIGGNTKLIMQVPQQAGNTVIVQQGYRGEWIGQLKATFDVQGVPSALSERIITLSPEYADDPAMVDLVAKYAKLYPTPTPEATPTELPTKQP